jgi:hypothetical protein
MIGAPQNLSSKMATRDLASTIISRMNVPELTQFIHDNQLATKRKYKRDECVAIVLKGIESGKVGIIDLRIATEKTRGGEQIDKTNKLIERLKRDFAPGDKVVWCKHDPPGTSQYFFGIFGYVVSCTPAVVVAVRLVRKATMRLSTVRNGFHCQYVEPMWDSIIDTADFEYVEAEILCVYDKQIMYEDSWRHS